MAATQDEAKWRETVREAQNTLYVAERPVSTMSRGPDPHVCFIRFLAQFQAKGLFSFESLCNHIGRDVADELMCQLFRIMNTGITSPLDVRNALGRIRRHQYYSDPFSALDFTILIANYTMTLFYEMSQQQPTRLTNQQEHDILELSRLVFAEAKKRFIKLAPAYAFYKICQHLQLNDHLTWVILNPVSGIDVTQDKDMKPIFEALGWSWIDTNEQAQKKL